MKLYHFVAENDHKALLRVHDELGMDALIYETKKTDQGVEVIAGLALNDEESPPVVAKTYKKHPSPNHNQEFIDKILYDHNLLVEKFNSEITRMNQGLLKLTEEIQTLGNCIMHSKVKSKKKFLRFDPLKKIFKFRKIFKEIKYEKQPIV